MALFRHTQEGGKERKRNEERTRIPIPRTTAPENFQPESTRLVFGRCSTEWFFSHPKSRAWELGQLMHGSDCPLINIHKNTNIKGTWNQRGHSRSSFHRTAQLSTSKTGHWQVGMKMEREALSQSLASCYSWLGDSPPSILGSSSRISPGRWF